MSTETKISTLIIEVDLQCEKCFKKVRKLLCKLQPTENITKIDYDNKKNTITISGPFDPQKLSMKLKCMSCGCIKNIKIKEPEKPPEKPVVNPPQPVVNPTANASSTAAVNLQFTNICGMCYPWPCSDPKSHLGVQPRPVVKKQDEQKAVANDKQEGAKVAGDSNKGGGGEKKSTKEEANKPTATASSTATVNFELSNICYICYPWPCSDQSHKCVQPQPQPQPKPQPQPQCCSPCQGQGGGHQQPCRWGNKCSPCGGSSYCGGGCGSCNRGTQCWQPTPMCCPGPFVCRGCNGCRIVRENKFSYEEYPSNPCAIM